MENSTLNSRYFIQEQIAQGGFCSVYKGFDIYDRFFNNSSFIVIKTPNDEMMKKSDISALLYAEYIFLKSLNHKNIVKVLDFGIDFSTNKPYLILEYIEGVELSKISYKELTLKEKNSIFKELRDTLEYIHFKGIVHCDISPSNIIIFENKPIIVDFGISYNKFNNKYITLDYTKNNVYNPRYTSPEVLKGEKPSFSSDIFSLAILTIEMYLNKPIFRVNSLEIMDLRIKLFNLSAIPFFIRLWLKRSLEVKTQNKLINKLCYKIFL